MKHLELLVVLAILTATLVSSATDAYKSWAAPLGLAGRGIVGIEAPHTWVVSTSDTIPPPFAVRVASVGLTDPAWSTLARNAGVRWAKTNVSWNNAYASQPPTVGGAFRSPLVYSEITDLVSAGFTLVVGIGGTPSAWLLNPGNPNGPMRPEYYQEFGRFLTALVNQYKNQVKYWDINFGYWEFDAFKDWGCYANEYATIMMTAGSAIHVADPSAIVVLGPLAYEWWDNATYAGTCGDPNAVFNRTFLDTVVQSGAAPYFDAIAFNFYHRLVGIGPNKPWTTGPGKAKSLLDKLPPDQRNKIFLITEMGEAYQGTPGGNGPTIATPEYSARAVPQMYAQVLSGSDPTYRVSGIRIDAAFWMSLDSYGPNSSRIYGLVDNNVTLHTLPAYDAYKTLTAELAGATFNQLFSLPGVEGYVFNLPGGATKTVVWAKPWYTNSPVTVTFPGTGLRIVDKLGNPVTGTVVGGQTQVQVTGSPIYVGPPGAPIPCPWDFVAPPQVVDVADLQDIASRWRATPGSPLWDSKYDLNPNNKIDVGDIMTVAAHMGSCP